MTTHYTQEESRALSSSAQRLKKLQLALGSWAKVAAALGISQQMIFAVMKGSRQPSDKVLARLSKVEHEQNVLTLVDAAQALADERGGGPQTRSILRDVLAPAEQEYQERVKWQQKAEALERKVESMRRRLREILADTDDIETGESVSSKSPELAGKKLIQTLGERVRPASREARRQPAPGSPSTVSAKHEAPAPSSSELPSPPKRGRV